MKDTQTQGHKKHTKDMRYMRNSTDKTDRFKRLVRHDKLRDKHKSHEKKDT